MTEFTSLWVQLSSQFVYFSALLITQSNIRHSNTLYKYKIYRVALKEAVILLSGATYFTLIRSEIYLM